MCAASFAQKKEKKMLYGLVHPQKKGFFFFFFTHPNVIPARLTYIKNTHTNFYTIDQPQVDLQKKKKKNCSIFCTD